MGGEFEETIASVAADLAAAPAAAAHNDDDDHGDGPRGEDPELSMLPESVCSIGGFQCAGSLELAIGSLIGLMSLLNTERGSACCLNASSSDSLLTVFLGGDSASNSGWSASISTHWFIKPDTRQLLNFYNVNDHIQNDVLTAPIAHIKHRLYTRIGDESMK